MKNKNKELNVDFIGGQEPMTKQEEFAISEFIKLHSSKGKLKTIRKTKTKTSLKDKQTA